eukprot:gene11544-11640_t
MDTANALLIFREQLKQFVSFNEAEWIVFSQHLHFRSLKKKAHFAVRGKDGEEITGYFSFENEFTSSYKSFLTQQPSLNYIQALEDTLLITISSHNMQLMLNNALLAYKMERFGRLVAEHYLICYEERMSAFIIKTPEERYIDLLNSSSKDVLQRIPQHYIAQFIGITPVSLSRIRRRILVSQ